MSTSLSHRHLLQFREEIPFWIREFKSSDLFDPQAFFASRVVFYPGCGSDGHAVKLFNSSGAAHCYLMVDYGVSENALEENLNSHGFIGYKIIHDSPLKQADFNNRWQPHLQLDESQRHSLRHFAKPILPFGRFLVFERLAEFGPEHGAERFAVVFLCADGIATYDALFCQPDSPPAPYCVLIHDHGFGGNYNRFGRGGLLERLHLEHARSAPEWLLVHGDAAWRGYELETAAAPRSLWWRGRYLYRNRSSRLSNRQANKGDSPSNSFTPA